MTTFRRVLVCGGRDYNDYPTLSDVLETYDIAVLIHGVAKGADSLADCFAKNGNLTVERYPADWETYGKRAGYIRNKQMLDEGKPDLVIAFPGGKGTANMVKLARDAGVEVIEIDT